MCKRFFAVRSANQTVASSASCSNSAREREIWHRWEICLLWCQRKGNRSEIQNSRAMCVCGKSAILRRWLVRARCIPITCSCEVFWLARFLSDCLYHRPCILSHTGLVDLYSFTRTLTFFRNELTGPPAFSLRVRILYLASRTLLLGDSRCRVTFFHCL